MGKDLKMSGINGIFKKAYVLMTACFVLSFYITVFPGIATGFDTDLKKKTIVIDPGHGGKDIGTRGPGGSFEKTVTMNVAEALKNHLNEMFRVVLTRQGDYSLDIFSRTAVANHEEASVFISLHTGASRFHSASGFNIFHIEIPLRLPSEDQQNSRDFEGGVRDWDDIQKNHASRSAVLAREIGKQLMGEKKAAHHIREAPILVLKGADMPAVLVEIGFITNPSEEKMLSDPDYLGELSKALSDAIRIFLEKMN